MKKKIFFSLLATVMLFAACGDSNDEATPDGNETLTQDQEVTHQDKETESQDNDFNLSESPEGVAGTNVKGSIINWFYEPETLDVRFISKEQGADNGAFSIYAVHNVDKISENHWYPSSENGQKYVEYYGDTTFSGFCYYGKQQYGVSAMPLNTINISANKAFDMEHPAGVSLNDIFTLEYASAWNLIQSNYNPDINIRQWGKYQAMPLSDFKALQLPCYCMYLNFNKLPEKPDTYEFTITFDYGKDPISGREVKVAPAVVKAEFTEKDYVKILER